MANVEQSKKNSNLKTCNDFGKNLKQTLIDVWQRMKKDKLKFGLTDYIASKKNDFSVYFVINISKILKKHMKIQLEIKISTYAYSKKNKYVILLVIE